jgi:hypothetical protein
MSILVDSVGTEGLNSTNGIDGLYNGRKASGYTSIGVKTRQKYKWAGGYLPI